MLSLNKRFSKMWGVKIGRKKRNRKFCFDEYLREKTDKPQSTKATKVDPKKKVAEELKMKEGDE